LQLRLLHSIIGDANKTGKIRNVKKRQIEREFGVPIAGEVLDPSLWTQTALKKLPPDGPLDVAALFGRRAPLVVDLGCGNARFLIGSAVWRPTLDHIGIDILPLVLRYATRRANQRGLANVRFAAADAQTFVGRYLAAGGVREVHCYHPQPYHDPREAGRRLFTPVFLAALHRVLEPGGGFFVQTDNAPYWNYLCTVLPHFFDFREQPGPWPDAPRGRTRREIIALRRGLAVYRGQGIAKLLTAEERDRRAAELPLPTFDAGPRTRELDEMEHAGG
jgi:tRNA (guanine-N7-)-methyltransferase